MADWPLGNGGRAEAIGNATFWDGTSVPSGTTGTKSAWTELIASCPVDADYLIVQCGNGGNSTSGFLDIGIGASGAEQVLAPDLYFGTTLAGMFTYVLPLRVPLGARIAGRGVGNGSADKVTVIAVAQGAAGPKSCTRMEALGQGTGAVPALAITTGSSVKSAWTQVTAATSFPYRWIGVELCGGTASLKVATDIGFGASGAEQVVIPDLRGFMPSDADPTGGLWLFPCSIPAGSRLAIRAAGSSAATNTYYMVYGIG